MSVLTIDGSLFRLMVINGAIHLKQNSEKVNNLNVFPVPDGDTGSNMSATIINGARDVFELEDKEIDKVAKVASRGLLMGARGNSGVILSQLFSGISKGLKGKSEVNVIEFAQALERGFQQAYLAVINPVEGTILTVSKDAGLKLKSEIDHIHNFEELFDVYIKEAEESLDRTPDLLPVLKEVGVVDSGGAGYCEILYGMRDAIKGIMGDLRTIGLSSGEEVSVENDSEFVRQESLGYNLEASIELNPNLVFDNIKFVSEIGKHSTNLEHQVEGLKLSFNLHTSKPGDVLNVVTGYGLIKDLKVEIGEAKVTEKPVEEEPEENVLDAYVKKQRSEFKEVGLVSVLTGDGIKKTFYELGCDYIIDGGQTMNPSTEDFLNAVKEVNAASVIIIPNNKNVFMSAESAAKLIKNKKVMVLPAKTIAQGYASLLMFDSTLSIEENIEEMSEHIKNVKSGEVTYAIRDSIVNELKIRKDDFIGISENKIVVNGIERLEVTKSLIDIIDKEDAEIITVFYGATVSENEAQSIADYISNMYELEVEVINGGQEIYSYILAVE